MADWTGSKDPVLDARIEGSETFTATANSTTTHYIVFDFDCEFEGLEIAADNPTFGDHVEMSTEYNAGAYGWKRYKKFGKRFNIYPNHVSRIILFPTLPSAGVRIAISYTNTGNSDTKFSINKFQYVSRTVVKPSELQEGEDW